MHSSQVMRSRAPFRKTTGPVLLLCSWAFAATPRTRSQETCPSNLVVIVLDQSQLPVPGARVEVKLGDRAIAAASTNETGHADLAWCKPGRFAVSALKEGFETASKAVDEVVRVITPEDFFRLFVRPAGLLRELRAAAAKSLTALLLGGAPARAGAGRRAGAALETGARFNREILIRRECWPYSQPV